MWNVQVISDVGAATNREVKLRGWKPLPWISWFDGISGLLNNHMKRLLKTYYLTDEH